METWEDVEMRKFEFALYGDHLHVDENRTRNGVQVYMVILHIISIYIYIHTLHFYLHTVSSPLFVETRSFCRREDG